MPLPPIEPPRWWIVLATYFAGSPLVLGLVFALQSAKTQGFVDVALEALAYASLWWYMGLKGEWVITFLTTAGAAVLFWFSCRGLSRGAPRIAASRWLWVASLAVLGACVSFVAWAAALLVMPAQDMLIFVPFVTGTGAFLAAIVGASSRRRAAA